MVLKIRGVARSTCGQLVFMTLNELGVPFEIVPVDFAAAEHKSPEYLKVHPFGQIPILVEEDGFTLYESRAIARYVVHKYGANSGLIPSGDLKKLALFEQAASIEGNNFYPYASGLAVEKYFKPLQGLKGNDERAAEYAQALETKLKVYEVILGKQKYIAGDEFTLADIMHIPYGSLLTENVGFEGLKATPNVARWWADITSRESWKSVVAAAKN